MEQKSKTVNIDTDGVKERKLDPKLKRSRSITIDAIDTLYRKEIGDAQEEFRGCLERGDRYQSLLDYVDRLREVKFGLRWIVSETCHCQIGKIGEPKVPGEFLLWSASGLFVPTSRVFLSYNGRIIKSNASIS